jgi:hypothetical protein
MRSGQRRSDSHTGSDDTADSNGPGMGRAAVALKMLALHEKTYKDGSMTKRTRFSPEVQERAVRLVQEHRAEYETHVRSKACTRRSSSRKHGA